MEAADIFAAVFLVATVAAPPLVWMAVLFLRLRYSLPHFVGWLLVILLVRLQWRATLPRRPFPLPADRGAVIVCNHRSSIDPLYVQALLDRTVHWFVAKEYFAIPGVGWFLRFCGAIPTTRGGQDTAAVKMAIRYLKQGDCVGLLPEGRINMTENTLLPVRPGAALLAMQARVPVIPMYIIGSPFDCYFWTPFLMTARSEARVGRPIEISARAADGAKRDKSEAARQAILAVAREMCRLAGAPGFPVRLAGRDFRPSDEQIKRDHTAFRARKRAARQNARR